MMRSKNKLNFCYSSKYDTEGVSKRKKERKTERERERDRLKDRQLEKQKETKSNVM